MNTRILAVAAALATLVSVAPAFAAVSSIAAPVGEETNAAPGALPSDLFGPSPGYPPVAGHSARVSASCDRILATPRMHSKAQLDFCLSATRG
jgi:hypothetical protein